jgi:hypothetical protein
MGGLSCSEFLRAARTSDILYHQAANWLLGYFAGLNAVSSGAAAPLTGDQVLKTAAEFCEANPSSAIANASSHWAVALPKQAETRPRGGSLILNLDRAPDRRPILERR